MEKSEKDIRREQQLPGHNFSSGSTTLYEIAESHGKKLGKPQSIPSDAVQLEKDEKILKAAIPADQIEARLYRKTQSKVAIQTSSRVKRGTVMLHKPTRNKVVILRPDVDNIDGEIRHEIQVIGTDKKYKVPEKSLGELNGKLKH